MYLDRKDRRSQLIENPYQSVAPDELAFVLTQIVMDYMSPEPDFDEYNSVLGVMEFVKQEFIKKAALTYLDGREQLNGGIGYEDLPQNKGSQI